MSPASLPPGLAARPGVATPFPARSVPLHWQGGPGEGAAVALAWQGAHLMVLSLRGGKANWSLRLPPGMAGPARPLPLALALGPQVALIPLGGHGWAAAGGPWVVWTPDGRGPLRRWRLPAGPVRGLAARPGMLAVSGGAPGLWQVRLETGRVTPLPRPALLGVPGAAVPWGQGWAVVRWQAPGGRDLGTSVAVGGGGRPWRVVHLPALYLAVWRGVLLASGGDYAQGVRLWTGTGPPVPVRALGGAGAWGDPLVAASDGVVWAAAAARGEVEGLGLAGPPRAYRLALPQDLVLVRHGAVARWTWRRPQVTALAAAPGRVAVALSDGRLGWATLPSGPRGAALRNPPPAPGWAPPGRGWRR